jgi:sugar lactone lactonase YvrE
MKSVLCLARPLMFLALLLAAAHTASADTVYVSDMSESGVNLVASDGSVTKIATQIIDSTGLAIGPNGNLYVAGFSSSGSIFEISPTGTVSTFATGFSWPLGIAFDSAGNLYVANSNFGGEASASSISMITPSGVISTFVTLGSDYPASIAFDSSGNLFFANWSVADGNGNGTIYKVTPSGTVSTFATGLTDSFALTIDNSNNVYVGSGSTVEKITLQGIKSLYATLPTSGLMSMAFENNGNLLVGSEDTGDLYQITSDHFVSTYASGLDIPTFIADPSVALPVPTPSSLALVLAGCPLLLLTVRRLRL